MLRAVVPQRRRAVPAYLDPQVIEVVIEMNGGEVTSTAQSPDEMWRWLF